MRGGHAHQTITGSAFTHNQQSCSPCGKKLGCTERTHLCKGEQTAASRKKPGFNKWIVCCSEIKCVFKAEIFSLVFFLKLWCFFSGADIRKVDMRNLTSGVLHTKFWVVDKKHIYIGSANMDWRSLTQVCVKRLEAGSDQQRKRTRQTQRRSVTFPVKGCLESKSIAWSSAFWPLPASVGENSLILTSLTKTQAIIEILHLVFYFFLDPRNI